MATFTKKQIRKVTPASDILLDVLNFPPLQTVIVSLDVEAWDVSHQTITEIGLVIFTTSGVLTSYHCRAKEYLTKRNKYSSSHKSHFKYGLSEIISIKEFYSVLELAFRPLYQHFDGVVITAHNIDSDLKLLKNASDFTWEPPVDKTHILDAEMLARVWFQRWGGLKVADVCDDLSIPYSKTELHNAGNDAWLTAHCVYTWLQNPHVVTYANRFMILKSDPELWQ